MCTTYRTEKCIYVYTKTVTVIAVVPGFESGRAAEHVRDVVGDELNGNLVVRAPRDNHVGKLLGRHTELLVGRLHKVDVVVQNLQ